MKTYFVSFLDQSDFFVRVVVVVVVFVLIALKQN